MDNTCSLIPMNFRPDCPYRFGTIVAAMFFNPNRDNGDTNFFANVSEFNLSNVVAKLNEFSPTNRAYPLKNLRNSEDQSDPVQFEKFSDNVQARTSKAVYRYSYLMPSTNPKYTARLDSWVGQNFGAIFIDQDGNVLYYTDKKTRTTVGGLPMNMSAWDATPRLATPQTSAGIIISFELSLTMDWGQTDVIYASNLDFNFLGSEITGLFYFSNFSIASGTTSQLITNEIKSESGNLVTGLKKEDFIVYNKNTSSVVTIDTILESAPGKYTLGFATQNANDVLQLQPNKTGFVRNSIELPEATYPTINVS